MGCAHKHKTLKGNPGTLEQAASALRWVASKNQMAMPTQILGGQSLPATLGQQTGVEPGTEALWEAVTHTWDHGHWRLALQREPSTHPPTANPVT